MVVDDSPQARSAIERILLRAGYEVSQASSGQEALYILEQRKFDCILLDHLMPELDGLEVARTVKKDKKLKIIPIIMLTGLEAEDDIIAGLNAGADDYVIKTSAPDIIIARVEAMLRLGKLQRELFEKNILLEKANADLRRLDDLKSEFVSTVSHELRTPLSITREGLKLVLGEVTGCLNKQQKELLDVATGNIERLSKIINDILDISKIESGRLPLHKRVTDMNQILRNSFSFYKNMAKQKDIEFNLDIPKHKIKIYLDSDRIEQVLINLISNALKFNKEGGSLRIKLKADDEKVVCSVEDTGMGIATSDLDKIFDKFQQFGRTHGPGEKGTGLGLSIVKKIIQMHGGRIWVKSELGRGSTFSFSLPRYSAEDILREHIKNGLEDAQEKMSKFTLLSIRVSGAYNDAFLYDMEEEIKKILRHSMDSTMICKDKIIIFLGNAHKDGAQAVKKRIIDSHDRYILGGKRFKEKINFNALVVSYPEDAASVDDLVKRIE